MSIKIVNELKIIDSKASLFSIQYNVNVTKSSKQLLEQMSSAVNEISSNYQLEDIKEMQAINDTRNSYKLLGASPSRYRNAAEAMVRRVVQGKGLYKINNIIDIQNMTSITSGISIGSYDLEKLSGKIVYKRAEEEQYQGIGKEQINITSLPCLYDDKGPFGNPTSDSRRAMITSESHNILTIFYSFSDEKITETAVRNFLNQLDKYTDAKDISVDKF